jgi:hypothetical protein
MFLVSEANDTTFIVSGRFDGEIKLADDED